MNKQMRSLLADYRRLANRLGKLPSRNDLRLYGVNTSSIDNHFGTFGKFKSSALEFYPALAELFCAVPLTVSDVEGFRVDTIKKLNNKNNKVTVENVNTLEFIAQFADKVFKGKVKANAYNKPHKETKRVLNLVLSDLHFGSDISKDETGALDYKKVQEARRFAHVIKETIEYKKQYRAETSLKVLLLGDIIQGNLHDPRDAAPMAEQFCRAVHLLIQGIAQLSEHFKDIEVVCQSGNHDRLVARHQGRAVNQKWDSVSTMIYYSVKSGCSNLKNVQFNIAKTPYTVYSNFGQKVLVTHGDTFLKLGYPGNNIATKSASNQLNSINAALPDADEIKVMVGGHVHTGSITYLSNGGTLITNGCLVPVDEFAVSIGMTESNSGQMIFESVPGFAMGDSRFIRVTGQHDMDETLDSVIKPWSNL